MTQSRDGNLVIRLFGTFAAERDGIPLSGLHLREGKRLLSYLILHHGEDVPYRTLAEKFWPAEAQSTSTYGGDYASTRQAVRSLRVALGPDAKCLQTVTRGVVRLELIGVEVDIFHFDTLAASENPNDWQKAVALYQGAVLEGWNDSWLLPARTRRQRDYDRLCQRSAVQEAPTRTKSFPSLSPPDSLPGPDDNVSLEPDSGAVALDSRFYITRTMDSAFYTALGRHDSIVLLKGARQMGKTSLLARGLEHTRNEGANVVFTDFQSLPSSRLESVESLYFALAIGIARQLGRKSPREEWDEDFDPHLNLEDFLVRVLEEKPLFWGLDEVDRLFTCPFGSEVFGLLRSWHNRRALEPSGPFSRLTLVIAYATEAHLFITDLNQSPFNVGTRLTLADFTLAETGELNRRYGSPLQTPQDLERFFAIFSGHPYLSRLAFNLMVGEQQTLAQIEREGVLPETPFHAHLRRLLLFVVGDRTLADTLRAILAGKPALSEEAFYRLRSAGVIIGESTTPHLRCDLYHHFFATQL
jgi:hypothetical protein